MTPITFRTVSSASTTRIFMAPSLASWSIRLAPLYFTGSPDANADPASPAPVTIVILFRDQSCFNLVKALTKVCRAVLRDVFYLMSHSKYSGRGADWTQLLTDPSLVSHLGELLQVYREATPEKRDQALLEAMRGIKGNVAKPPAKAATAQAISPSAPVVQTAPARPVATSPAASPPFEPDIFTPTSREDRRRHARMKCFVAVELRLGNS